MSSSDSCVDYNVTRSKSPKPKPPPPPPKGLKPPPKPQSAPQLLWLAPSFSTFNGSWFSPDGYGTNYYVSDADGEVLYFSGTVCAAGQDPVCGLKLYDGDYKWRVTGAQDEYSGAVQWSVCGMDGGAMNEFMFTVKGTTCTATSDLLDVTKVCYHREMNLAEDLVQLSGVIHLHGVSSSALDAPALSVIKDSISKELLDSKPTMPVLHDDVKISVSDVSDSFSHVVRTRGLAVVNSESLKVTEVSFSVNLRSDVFKLHGKSRSAEELGAALKTYLQRSMSSGLFLVRMRSGVRRIKSSAIHKVTKIELRDVRVTHVPSEMSTRIAYAVDFLLIAGAVSGLVFGALMVRYFTSKVRTIREYVVVTEESSHSNEAVSSRLSVTESNKRIPCELQSESSGFLI